MSFYFPDQMFHGRLGNLYPWDVRFDPTDAAFLSVGPEGDARFRVIVEPGFSDVHLVSADGRAHGMTCIAAGRRFDVYEVELAAADVPQRFTFALQRSDGVPVYLVPAGVSNAVERLDRWDFDGAAVRRVDTPDWAAGAVIYHIFPERFHSGDPSLTPPGAAAWGTEPRWLDFQGGDLIGIAAKAGYLADLGVDMVYVNPIFTSPSTHRYDAIDYYAVDPALGGNEALRTLVAALHEHRIRLVVDASFNHCHPQFAPFADVVANGDASSYRDWFLITEFPVEVRVRRDRLAGWRNTEEYDAYLDRFEAETGIPVVDVDDDGPPVEPTYEAWYGVPSLPRINLAHPAARSYFLDVARYWIREFDIDGWRMDVARYVDFDFWPEFRAAVKDVKPDAYLLAEIMGDAVPWLQGDTFDGTMNYTFRQLALDFFATGSSQGEDLADGLIRMYARYSPAVIAVSQNLLGSHDTARFLHEAGGDAVRLGLATVMQMTVPGAPSIYYGDEVGMTGGEEPGSRGAFPWHDESGWHTGQLDLVRSLTSLRRTRPSLRHGDFEVLDAGADHIAYLRRLDAETSVVVINRGPGEVAVPTASGPRILWSTGAVAAGDESLRLAGPGAAVAAG